MAKKKNQEEEPKQKRQEEYRLHPDTKKSIWAIVLFGLAATLALAAFGKAGPLGDAAYNLLRTLLGVGYFILPIALVFVGSIFILSERQRVLGIALLGSGLLMLSVLGIIEIVSPGNGGWLGLILGSLRIPFGETAAIILNVAILIISVLISINTPIKIRRKKKEAEDEEKAPIITGAEIKKDKKQEKSEEKNEEIEQEKDTHIAEKGISPTGIEHDKRKFSGNYVPPPLSLLKSTSEKPSTGDLLANANIIKRTLDSFGIPVEMGEINVGPAVTRYTLKPAEGVKLSRIEGLHNDLALALAAHPIRIEAPIPGKSLVGVEVPNKAAALVRLGSLINYPEFQKSGLLGFALGRDVNGDPIFSNIEKMPHMLVAGATGSGKSILIHSLLLSLLYKNSPETLKLILIDPKRVELSIYEGMPHLVSPVVVDSKKAIGVFKWAIGEMDRRYDLLLHAGSRDIKSYNSGIFSKSSGEEKIEPLPYLLIVVDELADLMTTYGREVEGSIVRLAQMSRATGIHLILSTQRPSVEVITGLIKANITSRVALQVASQIDSRTILDTSGAEKLLGHGDLLYISSELSKPKRIQGGYVTEEEVNKVAKFIRENNKEKADGEEKVDFSANGNHDNGKVSFDEYIEDGEDELYDEAVQIVAEAKKASASLLQRRLKVGYARAARLLDIMESREIIGPGDGAKPREVFLEKIENQNEQGG